MFNRKKIELMQEEIRELKNKVFDLENGKYNKVEIFSSYSNGITFISNTGQVEKEDRYCMSGADKYFVTVPYLLEKIINHLKMEIKYESGKSPEIKLEKIKKNKG